MADPAAPVAPVRNDGESDADYIKRLEAANVELQEAEKNEPAEAGSPAGPPPAPLDALKASIEANPEMSFADHLKKLADDGIKAVISPSVESDVVAALVAVVHDLLKGKLP